VFKARTLQTAVEEVHHIIPLSEGGTNDESNLMSLCRSCHEKIHKEIEETADELRGLFFCAKYFVTGRGEVYPVVRTK
jgi:hypothetical protein